MSYWMWYAIHGESFVYVPNAPYPLMTKAKVAQVQYDNTQASAVYLFGNRVIKPAIALEKGK